MYRRLYISGVVAYVCMLVLSILFYKERTIFLDAAFNVFNIIKDQGFCIQHYRFGDVFSQLLPVIATRAGLPLSSILEAYSAGFIIYYFAAYVVCGTILKRYDLALVILLMNILFVSDTFFYIPTQLTEGVALLMVVYALMLDRRPGSIGALSWAIILLAAATVVFFHPLVVFVLGFTIAFFLVGKTSSANRKMLYILAAVYVAGIAVKSIFFRNHYEGSSLSGMKNFVTQFPDYFTIYSNKRFLYSCVTKYYWIPVLFTGIVFFYARTKAFRKLVFFAAFFFGYLMLVNISYPTNVTSAFYMENLYIPLSIFLAFPFVFDLLPAMEKSKLVIPLFVWIVITGIGRMYFAHNVYSQRLAFERRYLDEYDGRKIIAKATKEDTDTLMMLWGTPYEFLLLSVAERGVPASVIIDEDPPHREWANQFTKSLVVNWNVFPYAALPAKYFHFTDTTSAYTIEGAAAKLK